MACLLVKNLKRAKLENGDLKKKNVHFFNKKVNTIQGSLCFMALLTKNIHHRENKQTTGQIYTYNGD